MEIRIRGRVQGVGFRSTVWRLARELRPRGEVFIDAEGVLVGAGGNESSIAAFISRTTSEPPPLLRIEAIETAHFAAVLPSYFRIGASTLGDIRTEISPDAAICEACAAEIADPSLARWFSCPKRWVSARGAEIQNHITKSHKRARLLHEVRPGGHTATMFGVRAMDLTRAIGMDAA